MKKKIALTNKSISFSYLRKKKKKKKKKYNNINYLQQQLK